jgi:hypothetical protein
LQQDQEVWEVISAEEHLNLTVPSAKNMEPASFRIADGKTTVPLHLEPWGTVFVVFRKTAHSSSRILPKFIDRSIANIEGSWAIVAVARKLAVLLHRLWVSGQVYDPLRNSRASMASIAPWMCTLLGFCFGHNCILPS